MNDRFLPDKAIDALDEAGSRVHITNIEVPQNIINIEKQLSDITTEKKVAIKKQKFEIAAELRDSEKKIQSQLEKQKEALSLTNKLFTTVLNNSFNQSLNINEESYFEDILKELKTEDIREERVTYLLNLLKTNTFKDVNNYNYAVEKLFNLLDEKLLEQKCSNKKIHIKVKK